MNRSLHIGLNNVDPKAYGGWNGELFGCHNDAMAMASIAQEHGFSPSILLDDEARVKLVLDALHTIAQQTGPGDTVLITYSGHGGQIYDDNADETDGLDETIVCYDGMIPDDRIYTALLEFKKGVRIVFISDSCHSGSIVKLAPGSYGRIRFAPLAACKTASPAATELLSPAGKRPRMSASVVQISGCADSQVSYDGAENGLFTEKLLKVYRSKTVLSDYRLFRNAINKELKKVQSSQILLIGPRDTSFVSGEVFGTLPF